MEICELIEPPVPLLVSIYYCDKQFHTDQIEKLFTSNEDNHGIVVILGDSCQFYKLSNVNSRPVKLGEISICRQKSQRKGGQSAPRFQRIRLNQIDSYVKMICENLVKWYTKDDLVTIKTLSLTGPAEIKGKVVTALNDLLNQRFRNILLPISNDSELQLALPEIKENISKNQSSEENKCFDRFLELSRVNSQLVSYGKDSVRDLVNLNMVKELFILESSCVHNEGLILQVESSGGTIIKVKYHRVLESYGGLCVVLWFPLDD